MHKQPTNFMFERDEVEPYAFVNRLFTPNECNKIIEYATKNADEKDATVNHDKVKLDRRDSKLCWLYPEDESKWIFEKIAYAITHLNDHYFKFDIYGLGEGLQFTTYKAPSGFYGKHLDRMYGYLVRKLSVSILLTDPAEFEGGDLCFHFDNEPKIMKKEQGMLYMFPSWTLHEVTPITQGERTSLVCWANGKPFR